MYRSSDQAQATRIPCIKWRQILVLKALCFINLKSIDNIVYFAEYKYNYARSSSSTSSSSESLIG